VVVVPVVPGGVCMEIEDKAKGRDVEDEEAAVSTAHEGHSFGG